MNTVKLRFVALLLVQRVQEALQRAAEKLLHSLDVRVGTHSYTTDDGYRVTGTEEQCDDALRADELDAASGQDMADMDTYVWVLNLDGIREVFAIGREETDDEVAILTLAANTAWRQHEVDDEDYEE